MSDPDYGLPPHLQRTPPPTSMRVGEYARPYPQAVKHEAETDAEFADRYATQDADNRRAARETMKRQGCKSIRFEQLETGQLVAHGYVGRVSGPNVEDL